MKNLCSSVRSLQLYHPPTTGARTAMGHFLWSASPQVSVQIFRCAQTFLSGIFDVPAGPGSTFSMHQAVPVQTFRLTLAARVD